MRSAFALLLLLASTNVAFGTQSSGMIRFSLHDANGALHTEREWEGKKAIVLIFTAIDCPIGNSYAPEFQRLYTEYAAQGVAFYAVQSDGNETPEHAQKYAADFGYRFPMILDSKQVLARRVGATTTPEAAVLSQAGELMYLGRIDDKYPSIGKSRYAATELDLRNAISAVLMKRPVHPDRTTPVGCSIVFADRRGEQK